MKRIFIAVDISDAVRSKAASYVDGIRRAFPKLRVGWERPEKLHLTLKFLADVNERELMEVQQVLSKLADASCAFQLTIRGTGVFPPRGDPRILWLGAEDGGKLAEIALRIDNELSRLGFEKEKRIFSPHLTIGRLREPGLSHELAAAHENNQFGPVGFEVREIVIYESELLPKGSVYTPIGKYCLKAR